jgi:3-oxoacyl-[acyl-carrier-protein] synthase-3
MMNSKITGLGFYVPERIMNNEEVCATIDSSDEWITERTGIKERRIFNPETDTVSNMAAKAARIALDRAGKTPKEVDAIFFATLSPDYYFPGSGVLLQKHLGLNKIPCFDLRAQCAGFIYALSVADQYIKTGKFKTVLVAGSEIQTNILEMSNRGKAMGVLFGDGAGVVVLEATNEKGKGLISINQYAEGKFAEELYCKLPSSHLPCRFPTDAWETGDALPHMNGKLVYIHAVKAMCEVLRESLAEVNLKESDIDLFIPHQANRRICEAVQKQLGISEEKVVININKYGNTTAASIPIALTETWEQGKIKDGDLIALASFGSGFVWGSSLIRW